MMSSTAPEEEIAPKHAMQAIVATIPQLNAIIPQTRPAVAIPFDSGFFLEIEPKMIAMIPQIEPTQPIPATPPPREINKAIIPKTKDATAIFSSF